MSNAVSVEQGWWILSIRFTILHHPPPFFLLDCVSLYSTGTRASPRSSPPLSFQRISKPCALFALLVRESFVVI